MTGLAEGTSQACVGSTDSVTATVPPPPVGPFDCKDAKPIDELKMTWDGTGDICVKAWDGAAGGTLLATMDNVAEGEKVDKKIYKKF